VLVVLLVMSAVVAMVTAVVAGGLLLPARHVITRERDVNASPDSVWAHVAVPTTYATWQRHVRRIESLAESPMRWREFTVDGAFTWQCTNAHAPHRFVARVIDDDVQRQPERTISLETTTHGTRIRCTEVAVHLNPIPRFVYRYLLRPEPQLDALLDDLVLALDASAAADSSR
jgi:uncharacterized protein YndB with AHSA1/START domain